MSLTDLHRRLLDEGNPPPFYIPRPHYFEPEEPKMCPACAQGGVCGCICFSPKVT